MKKIFIFLLISFFIFSCSKNDNKDNNSNIKGWTWVITESGSDDIPYKYLVQLINQKELIKTLEDEKNNYYLEEIPRIVSYYWDNPFYEFYFFSSVKEKDKTICNKIKTDKEKILCSALFDNSQNKKSFIDIYKKSWWDELFAENLYIFYSKLRKGLIDCRWLNDIITYFACKKIINKDFDVNNYFLKYTILQRSNKDMVKNYYLKVIDKWGLVESDFWDFVKSSIVKN